LTAARGLDSTVGFVMVTGAGTVGDAIEALRQGADDYILKPFDLDEVRHTVMRTLHHRKLLLESREHKRLLEERLAAQAQQIERMFVDALLAIANAVEVREGYTGRHIEKVTRHAVAIARKMGLEPEALRKLWIGGLLHDVGK